MKFGIYDILQNEFITNNIFVVIEFKTFKEALKELKKNYNEETHIVQEIK